MQTENLIVKDEGPVTRITLNRPEKRNALALDVMLELTAAFREVGASDALGVVLAANGPVFSAGHNFGDMKGVGLAEARLPANPGRCQLPFFAGKLVQKPNSDP